MHPFANMTTTYKTFVPPDLFVCDVINRLSPKDAATKPYAGLASNISICKGLGYKMGIIIQDSRMV
jgi:hypothetical protein